MSWPKSSGAGPRPPRVALRSRWRCAIAGATASTAGCWRGRAGQGREGRVTRWVGSSVDIEDLKQVEASRRASDERLRQAQRLEAVGRLAGGVAHDFNNMLTAILGYSELLAGGGPAAGDAAAGQTSRRSSEAADRAAALTRQLLAFGRRAGARAAGRSTSTAGRRRRCERMLRAACSARTSSCALTLEPESWPRRRRPRPARAGAR